MRLADIHSENIDFYSDDASMHSDSEQPKLRKFSSFNRKMDVLFSSLEMDNQEELRTRGYNSGDSLYSNPIAPVQKSSRPSPIQTAINDSVELQDGFGNVVVNKISPVFTSNPILPIRSPAPSVRASLDNESNISTGSRDTKIKSQESSWFASNSPLTPPNSTSHVSSWLGSTSNIAQITPPNSNPTSKRNSLSSVISNSNSLKPKLFPERRNSRASVNTVVSDYSICSAPGRAPLRVKSPVERYDNVTEKPFAYSRFDDIIPDPKAYSRFDDIIPSLDDLNTKPRFSPLPYDQSPRSSFYSERRSLDSGRPRLYTPRRSLDEGRSALKILSPSSRLNAIEEEEEHSTLKRAFSLPSRKMLDSTDMAILSTFLMKKNRRGIFQKRLIRFDGIVFICMSSTFKPTKSVADMDFLSSPIDTIKKLQQVIRDIYPPGLVSSLAKMMISKGNMTSIDSDSTSYYVPKWIIPVSTVKTIKTYGDNVFKIVTESGEFTFKTYTHSEKELIKSLFDKVLSVERASGILQTNSDSTRVYEIQKRSEDDFRAMQGCWKEALRQAMRDANVGPKITTLLVEDKGIKSMRGVVLEDQPTRMDDFVSRFTRKRKLVEPIRTSRDISRSIAEIDKEMALLGL